MYRKTKHCPLVSQPTISQPYIPALPWASKCPKSGQKSIALQLCVRLPAFLLPSQRPLVSASYLPWLIAAAALISVVCGVRAAFVAAFLAQDHLRALLRNEKTAERMSVSAIPYALSALANFVAHPRIPEKSGRQTSEVASCGVIPASFNRAYQRPTIGAPARFLWCFHPFSSSHAICFAAQALPVISTSSSCESVSDGLVTLRHPSRLSCSTER